MSEIAQPLLAHIRSKQFLVCAAGSPDTSGHPTLAEITAAMQLRSAECLRLVAYLQAKGLVEPAPDARGVRLTARGQRLVRRMTRASEQNPESSDDLPTLAAPMG